MMFFLRAFFLFGILFSAHTIAFTQHPTNHSLLTFVGELENAELEPDYNYYGFDANNRFLIWFEGYTGILFIYDIAHKNLNEVVLKKGRGPNEYQTIPGFFISDDDLIYLVDYGNAKYIRLNSFGDFLEDLTPQPGIMPAGMAGSDHYKVIRDDVNQSALFYLYESETNSYEPLEISPTHIPDDFFRDVYKKSGRYTINDHLLVHATRYYPNLYIYDLEEKVLIKRIQFDESEVIETEPVSTEAGGRMTFPPEKVDILNQDIARIPGSPGHVLMLSQGKSKSRDYGLDRLFEYDIINEEFVNVYELGVEAKSIAVNDRYLFVYSEKEYKIYQYEIIRTE